MTPPRPTFTGRAVAARPLLLLAIAVIVSACLGGELGDAGVTPSASVTSGQPSPSTAAASPTLQPSPSASPTVAPTESPSATETPVEEATPTLP
ncbi:MAG TPA: hypothetical protein VJS87_02155, partial [Solirubrobacterales bacterium]|nr:hypothetical protein [Solirubrobacterales bacterium]